MKMVAVEDNNSKMSIQAADRDHVGWEQQTEPGGRALGSLQSDVEWDPLHFPANHEQAEPHRFPIEFLKTSSRAGEQRSLCRLGTPEIGNW